MKHLVAQSEGMLWQCCMLAAPESICLQCAGADSIQNLMKHPFFESEFAHSFINIC